MGGLCLQSQQQTTDRYRWLSENKIKLIGFSLNADTYAMQLILKKAGINFDYEEVNMLKNEHESETFEKVHPCKFLPILQDGDAFIYGTTFIMLMHVCNRFKKQGERIMPKEFKAELSREYSAFEENQKRTIKLLRRMLIAKRMNKGAPAEQELIQKKQDFFNLVLPALDKKLSGKRFFVGDQQTMLDLMIFVEIETVLVLMQNGDFHTKETNQIKLHRFLDLWIQNVRGLPDFHEVNLDFCRKVQ